MDNLNELLAGVLDAEKKSAEINAAAVNEAREITLEAEREAKRRMQSAKERIKQAMSEYAEQVKAEAEAYRAEIVASGGVLGDTAVKAANLKKAEETIVEAYLKKHGCR